MATGAAEREGGGFDTFSRPLKIPRHGKEEEGAGGRVFVYVVYRESMVPVCVFPGMAIVYHTLKPFFMYSQLRNFCRMWLQVFSNLCTDQTLI